MPQITDRGFALDAYDGVAIGTVRIIGMGGAAVATAEGSAGTLLNAAAPAVRAATSRDWWDWDFHLDAVTTTATSDHDNSGFAGEGSSSTTTAGLSGIVGDWGIAIVGTGLVGASQGLGQQSVETVVARGKVALAHTFLNEAFTVGAAIRSGAFSISASGQQLFRLVGTGVEVGGLWRPFRDDLRVGVSAALPVSGTEVDTSNCDPLDCAGHILPNRVVVPWQVAVGGAYRVGPTRWNQWVGGAFRDERSWLFAADVVLTGSAGSGAGMDAFARGLYQRSGQTISISPRLGGEVEAIPGRLRLRAGSYFEPARLAGTRGRIHATAGIEVRWLQFRLWGPRRLRFSLTADAARRYVNGGISIGLWH